MQCLTITIPYLITISYHIINTTLLRYLLTGLHFLLLPKENPVLVVRLSRDLSALQTKRRCSFLQRMQFDTRHHLAKEAFVILANNGAHGINTTHCSRIFKVSLTTLLKHPETMLEAVLHTPSYHF